MLISAGPGRPGRAGTGDCASSGTMGSSVPAGPQTLNVYAHQYQLAEHKLN